MQKLTLTLVLAILNVTCFSQVSKAKPDIFYISIGSCVYSKNETPKGNKPLFPEKIQIADLVKGFEQDYVAYKNDPRTIRREDSLSHILHSVTWSQQELAHLFAENTLQTDSLPGDIYMNRHDGPNRISRLLISGSDTTRLLEPPYLIDTLKEDIGSFFDSTDLKAAKKSATIISELLNKKGAVGITISSYELPISRDMIFASVDSLWKIVQKSHKPNPMIIFYYCGHGYADGYGRRFLVPGAFNGALNKMPIDIRRLRSVFVKDLYNYLELSGYPFMMLLDCCSDNQGVPPRDEINDYYSKMAINLDGIELSRAVYRQFFQPTGEAMVIYSSVLGSNSLPVPDAADKYSYTYVGPLCRRLQIADKKYNNLFFSFDQIRKRIMYKNLDNETQVPGIYCEDCPEVLVPIEKK